MASYSANLIKHATLSGTTVDTVTLTEKFIVAVEIANRGASDMSVTFGYGAAPTAPTTVPEDEVLLVQANDRITWPLPAVSAGDVRVSIKGNGNDYTVMGLYR